MPPTTLPLNLPTSGIVEYLVAAYRLGDEAAAEELVNRFQPYLLKWRRLLLYSHWDRKDKEVRDFLRLMGYKPPYERRLLFPLQLAAYEPEDIEQELRYVFLKTALSCPSIRAYFRFRLQQRLVSLLRDPLVAGWDRVDPLPEHAAAPEGPEIDELWVQGLTCGPGFVDLSVRDRSILRLHKVLGYTIEETAHRLQLGTATVKRSLLHCRQVLARFYVRP